MKTWNIRVKILEKFYDENNNKIYYNVSTTVKTQTGEISIFVYQEYIN